MDGMGPTLDLQQTVDRYGAPDYSPGYTVPDTLQGQDLPVMDTGTSAVSSVDAGHDSSTYATAGDQRRASRSAPNHYGWRHQHAQEMGAYRETTTTLTPPAGGSVTIDPNQVTVWELAPAGSVTLSLVPFEGFTVPDATAPTPYYAASVSLFVRLQAGATINWPPGLRWSSTTSASAFSAPSAQRDDCYLLVYTPVFGWMGHVISQGYK